MKLKDVTFEEYKYVCPKCKIPLNFRYWKPKTLIPLVGDIIFLLFTPKSWIEGYGYECDRCKHIYEIEKGD